jgi:hypothetical protein
MALPPAVASAVPATFTVAVPLVTVAVSDGSDGTLPKPPDGSFGFRCRRRTPAGWRQSRPATSAWQAATTEVAPRAEGRGDCVCRAVSAAAAGADALGDSTR